MSQTLQWFRKTLIWIVYRMHACLHVYIQACMLFLLACIYTCKHACYECMIACIRARIYNSNWCFAKPRQFKLASCEKSISHGANLNWHACYIIYVWMHTCLYIYMQACMLWMHACVCIYTSMHAMNAWLLVCTCKHACFECMHV